MDYKRIIRTTLIVLAIAIVGAAAYFLWQFLTTRGFIGALPGTGPTPTVEVTEVGQGGAIGAVINTTEQTATQETKTVTQKLSIFIDTPTFEYWTNPREGSVYFSNLDGQLIKINSDNSRRLVSSQTLANLHNITSSPDGSLALAEFNYPALPTFSIFSASSTSWQPLPSGTISAAFSPDSKRVAYNDSSALKILDLTLQGTTEVQKMSQVGLRLNWLNNSSVLLSGVPSIGSMGYLYSFDLQNKTLKTLVNGEAGLDILWSADGSLGIKLSNDANRNASLSLIDNTAAPIANFTFRTIPEKCLIQDQVVYCGVPKNIKQGMAFPDDYYQKSVYFVDDIYKLDLPTGAITKLFDGNEVPLDIHNLKVRGNSLLFINRYDQKVYSLSLQ